MVTSALIVDDSPSQLGVLEAELCHAGVLSVVKAQNGREALDIVGEQPYRFQMIITDLRMPVLDGMQLIEAISDTGFLGGVAIYSSLDQRVVKLAIDLARKHHVHLIGNLGKPFDPEDLAMLIRRADHIAKQAIAEGQFTEQRDLIESIEKGNVLPYFQPQISSHSMKVKGFEILCRVKGINSTEILKPERFLSIVEKHGLIDLLTYKTLELALADFKIKMKEHEGFEKLTLALNILPQQLCNDKLPEMLMAVCNANDFPHENLIVEITEGQAIDTTKKTFTLERLRIAGFGVSLDDFGTGFTNMGQLRQYPFTEIKMDQSMIQNIHKDKVSQVILNTMVELSKNYPLNIVAEGVEKESEFNYLSHQGDITIQGHLVSRAKPVEEISRWMKVWNRQIHQQNNRTQAS